MHRGILQRGGDLREVHAAAADHLLAFLQLDAANVFAGRDLQVFVEQSRQVAGAHIHHLRHQRHRQFFPDMGADILLGTANDLIF